MIVPRQILFIDAYDSFTNNVVGLLEASLGVKVTVIHHDSPHVAGKGLVRLLRNFDAVVVGPGPGHPAKPEDIGLISRLWKLDEQDLLPILGVCLGFQSLALAHGATVEKLPRPRHGIVTNVTHRNTDIFAGTGAFQATNYHSLRVRLPTSAHHLVPLAWDLADPVNGDILLALRHSTKPFWGVQFHPESECTTATAAGLMMQNWWAQANAWSSLRGRIRGRDADRVLELPNLPSMNGSEKSPPVVQAVETLEPASPSPISNGHPSSALRWERLIEVNVAPTRLYEAIRDAGAGAVLLDSQDHPRGRFSILGIVDPKKSPRLVYQVANGLLHYQRSPETPTTGLPTCVDQVWPLLQEALDRSKPVQAHLPDDIPFWGGWMGYISYEAGLETIDVSLSEPCTPKPGAADINMVFVHRSIVIDHQSSSAVVQTLWPEDGAWMEEALAMVKRLSHRLPDEVSDGLDPVLERDLELSQIITPTGADYCAKVAACQDVLAVGDSYELCLTDESRLLSPATLDPWRLYKKLRRRNTAPFGAFLELDALEVIDKGTGGNLAGATVVGSSPERFLQWDRKGRLEFRPIKGTVKKGPGVTRADAHAILESSKEQAENLMIVDLIRHDLSGMVGAANCRVTQLMAVEEYETVYQLVSAIEGQIPPSGSAKRAPPSGLDVLRVSLPPGSMTGAPKKRSCEVLRDLEKRPRGVYSGVLGYLDVGGGGDFSVVIRTAFRDHADVEGSWRVGAGGAITIQSDVEAEFREMETKAASVLDALKPPVSQE